MSKQSTQSRVLVLTALLVAITGCGMDRTNPASSRARRDPAVAGNPNIIVFLVDDMGLMDTSVAMLTDEYGEPQRHPLNGWYRTPNMVRLAAMGTRFSDFYAHSVCSPTRISIMTGQNAARHRTTDYINPWQDNRTLDNEAFPLAQSQRGPPQWNWAGLKKGDLALPKLLRQVGYATIHVGKAHFAPFDHEGADPLNLGFDVNVAGSAIGAPGSYLGQADYGKESTNPLARPVPGLEKYHGTDTFLTEALTLEAISKVDEALDEKKPFFLYMSHYAVHSPFNSDDRFAPRYRDRGKSELAQNYATLIEGIDKSLGDLMDCLEEKGIAENTLIVFLGDNGGDAPLGGTDDISFYVEEVPKRALASRISDPLSSTPQLVQASTAAGNRSLPTSVWGGCRRELANSLRQRRAGPYFPRTGDPCWSLVGPSHPFLRDLNGSVGRDPNCKRTGTQE